MAAWREESERRADRWRKNRSPPTRDSPCAMRARYRRTAQTTRGDCCETRPTVAVVQPGGCLTLVRASSRQLPGWHGTGGPKAKPVMPVMPRAGIEDAGRCRLQRVPQTVRTKGRLDVIDVSKIAKRHDSTEKIVLPRQNPLRRVPPDHP